MNHYNSSYVYSYLYIEYVEYVATVHIFFYKKNFYKKMSLVKQLSQTIGYCLKQFLCTNSPYNMVTCTPKNYFLHIVDICLMPNGLRKWSILYENIFTYLYTLVQGDF